MKKLISSIAVIIGLNMSANAQYNPTANPFEQVRDVVAKTNVSQKHILVSIGGDWCIWCKRFNKVMEENDTLAQFTAQHYEKIFISYTKENKNLDFLSQYGNPHRMGFPVFLILDEHGKLLHIQNSAYLEDGKSGHDPKKIYSFLNDWTYKAVHQIKD